MKKVKVFGLVLILALLSSVAFACGDRKLTVEFMDGDTVVKTVKVAVGEKVETYAPTVTGKSFHGWYAVPNFKFNFEFGEPITKDTKVFGKFRPTAGTEDTRAWKIVGISPKGGALKASNWDNGNKDIPALKFTKAPNKLNEFEVTLDLYAGDEFQLIADNSFTNQHGYGYIRQVDKTILDGRDNVYQPDKLYISNIAVIKDGNYKLSLYTNLDAASPELLDEITVTRLSDAVVDKNYVTKPTLAGTITGGQPLTGAALDAMLFTKNTTTQKWELSVYMNKNDYVAVLVDPSWGYALRTATLANETAAAEYIDVTYAANFKAKKSGNFKFILEPAYNAVTGLPDAKNCKVTVEYVNATYTPITGATTLTFKDGDNSETAYVRSGARIPEYFIADTADKTFAGWYKADGSVMSFENELATTAAFTVESKYVTAAEHDERDMYLCGYGGSWDPEPADRTETTTNSATTPPTVTTKNFKANKLTQAASSSTYTITVDVAANAGFNISSFKGDARKDVEDDEGNTKSVVIKENKVGLYFKADSVDAASAALVTSVKAGANITIKDAGKYTISLNTLTRKITITKLAA